MYRDGKTGGDEENFQLKVAHLTEKKKSALMQS